MLGKKIDWMQTAWLAGVITLTSVAVSWLFANVLKTAVQPLFAAIQPVSPITGTVGEKILGLVSGIIPLGEIPAFGTVALFLSAVVMVLVGEFAIDTLKLPQLKKFFVYNGTAGRIASVIFYGAIPLYVVLVGFTLPPMSTIIGLAIYTTAVAFGSVFLAGWLKIRI